MIINLPASMLVLLMVLLVHTTCAKVVVCPNCGTTSVSYPLSTGPKCGEQSYKILCDGGVLKLDALDNTYQIVSVFPKNQTFVIQQPHLLPNTCASDDHATSSIQLNNSLLFTITHINCIDLTVELKWAPLQLPHCKTDACCDSTATCRVDGGGGLRCFCKPRYHWDAISGVCASDLTTTRPKRLVFVAGIMCSGVVFLAAVLVTTMLIRHQRIKAKQKQLAREREEMVSSGDGTKSAKIFTIKEIKRATNNFTSSALLGVGGFGEVYKGVLDCGTAVAVKCAKLGNTKSVDQVLNEVRILWQVNHKNLVHLIGCCIEKQPLLVYEFVPNGSLFQHLHDKREQPLTWTQRLGIAQDTAEGLAYLHFSASHPIYHRDVKSSNILLDHKMKAKVADFGLSRLAHPDLTHVTTCAQGTLGYLDPEYYWNYQLTDKSDVYSFGVLYIYIN